MRSRTKDLTSGSIIKLIIVFTLPLVAGQVFQNLYNSVDSLVVGNFVGKTGLAAVSASAEISGCLSGFFTGFSTGGAVLVARYFGAGDKRNLRESVHTLAAFSIIVGVLMAAAGILLTPQLLRIMDCPDSVFDEAAGYLRIYLIGVLFTSVYNVGAGILRAVGDSTRPFIYLVAASLTNIALDFVFVAGLKMGVEGAALATIIAQALSVILVYEKMLRTDDVYKLELKDLFKMNGRILKEITLLGLPAGLQSSLISVSNLFVQKAVNSFGDAAMAGIGAAKKIDRFVGTISQCLGLATTTFVSQNLGANKLDRAFKGIRYCLVMNMIYIFVLSVPIYVFAKEVVGVFIPDEESIAYGVNLLHVMMPLYFFQGLYQVFANSVRGFGQSIAVMGCSVFGMIVMRQLYLQLGMIIWPGNITVVNMAFPVGWFFAFLSVFICYWFMVRRKYRVVKD